MISYTPMGTDEFGDLKTSMTLIAKVWDNRKLPFPAPFGRFPFREVNRRVAAREHVTVHEMSKWYGYATSMARKGI